MTRAEWVAACAAILIKKLDLPEGEAEDVASTLADNEAQDSGSLDTAEWSTPADAADEEVDAWSQE